DIHVGTHKCGSQVGAMCGDPINTSTGNLYEVESDYASVGPIPLVFHRYYNSVGSGDSTIGARWTHTFSRTLVMQTSTEVKLFRDDGEIRYFQQCGGLWCDNIDETGTLAEMQSDQGYITGWTY